MRALEGLDRHVGHRRRNGRPWSPVDLATTEELKARSFSFQDLNKLRAVSNPTWVSDDLAVPQQQYKSGKLPAVKGMKLACVVGALLAAYRSGSVGLWLSAAEAASWFGISPRTWSRTYRALELAGIIRIIPVWRPKPDGKGGHCARERHRARNLYQLGPKLQEYVGPGLLEGIVGEGLPSSRWRSRCAAGARKRARMFRSRAFGEAWDKLERHRQRPEEPGTAPANCRPDCHPTRPPESPLLTEGVGGLSRGPSGPASRAPPPKIDVAPPSGAPELEDRVLEGGEGAPAPRGAVRCEDTRPTLDRLSKRDPKLADVLEQLRVAVSSDPKQPTAGEQDDGTKNATRARAGPIFRPGK